MGFETASMLILRKFTIDSLPDFQVEGEPKSILIREILRM
jgi:hypothetical protein